MKTKQKPPDLLRGLPSDFCSDLFLCGQDSTQAWVTHGTVIVAELGAVVLGELGGAFCACTGALFFVGLGSA